MFINRFGQGFSGQLLKNPKQMAKYISSIFLKISIIYLLKRAISTHKFCGRPKK